MLSLLKIEWIKVKHYRTFWLLSLLYLISLYGINFIAYRIQDARPKKNDMANLLIGNPPFQFPEVWKTVSYMSSFILFIPGLLIIISLTNEFSFKTHRQNIIDGWSRHEFIVVKMLLTLILAVVSTVAVFITAICFGLFERGSNFSIENIEFIGYFFVQAISYTAVGLLFGLLFKRSGIAIGVFFLYVVVLENMLAGLLNKYVYNSGRFLPIETTDNLIPFPFLRNIVNPYLTITDPLLLLVLSAVYLTIYYFICLKKFEVEDL